MARRGLCRACCREVAVNADGTARVHGRKMRVYTTNFDGVKRVPKGVEYMNDGCRGNGMPVTELVHSSPRVTQALERARQRDEEIKRATRLTPEKLHTPFR